LQTTPGESLKIKGLVFFSPWMLKLVMAFGNNSVALEGLESKQGEEKRASVVNALHLQTPAFTSDRCLFKPLIF